MRPMRVLGWGLAGVVLSGSVAAAQFASDRAAPPTANPVSSTNPGTNAPGSPADHPWYVKPEHGQWMICVKSYTGPQARELAEELAREVRETYKVPAYLFERGSEERKKQEEFVAKERARQRAEHAEFLKVADRMREEARKKGLDFEESPLRIRVPRFDKLNKDWAEQYAVLVGGWKDMDTARKELDKIRVWQPPKNEQLMDRGMIARPGEGGQATAEAAYINPFLYALVVPNPVAPKGAADYGEAEAIFKLNAKEELSVLRIAKPWTLVVKSFHPPVRLRDKDGEKSVVERLFGKDESARELAATAAQAVVMAKMLRDPKFKPHPFDAYVLHTLYGSVVCVGQFEAADDPALYETHRTLEAMTFQVRREDEVGVKSNVRLFDPMFAMPVPRRK